MLMMILPWVIPFPFAHAIFNKAERTLDAFGRFDMDAKVGFTAGIAVG